MKYIFLLTTSFLVSGIVFAQSNVQFSVKAGLSSASMRGDAVQNLGSLVSQTNGIISTKSRTGFYAGGYVDVPLGNELSVGSGLSYTQKGYGLQGDLNIKGLGFLGANATTQLQADYIDIPLLIKLKSGGFSAFAGPQVSYLNKATLQTRAGVLGVNLLNNNTDVTSNFNRWDMGVTAGVAYAFTQNFGVEVAYDYGLSKVDAGKSVSSYNQALKVGLAVGF